MAANTIDAEKPTVIGESSGCWPKLPTDCRWSKSKYVVLVIYLTLRDVRSVPVASRRMLHCAPGERGSLPPSSA